MAISRCYSPWLEGTQTWYGEATQGCQSHSGAARAQREINSLRACEYMTEYDQTRTATDKLNSEFESTAWRKHLSSMRAILDVLGDRLQ